MKKIALMMSVYKNSKLEEVKTTLESIYHQTLKPDIFLVADGPIDNELKEFLLKQPIELFFLEKNVGIPKAHNFLLKKILKKDYNYIARMDGDDFMVKNRIELQYNFLERHKDIDVVGGYIKEIYEDGSEKVIKYPLKNDEMFEFFKKRVPFANMTTFFRKEFFDKVGLYPETSPTNEDSLLWLKGFKAKCEFANIPEVLVIVKASNDYLKRRGGFQKAFSDFKDRLLISKELQYGFKGYLYAFALFCVSVLPYHLKKIIYKMFR